MSRNAHPFRPSLGALAALLALSLPAPPANATLDAPVKLRLQDGRLAAHAGEVYRGVVEVVVPHGLAKSPMLTNLRIASPAGWRDVSLALAKAEDLGKAGVHAVPFNALVDDPEQPLVVVVDVDGRPVGRAFLMSEAAILDRTTPVSLVQVEGSELLGFPGMDLSLPRPDLPAEPPAIKDPAPKGMSPDGAPLHSPSPDRPLPDGVQDPEDPALPNHDRSIRVHGRFAYRRTDGQVSGVDGAVARVYDDDWCCDELLAQVVTDPWGNFDVTFNWDPCFVCDGEPDIYVEFELDNSVVQVQADDLLEADYTFESGRWNNFDGSVLNVGTQMPGDWYKMASCHIHTTIVRAWRWILVHQGRNVPQVDVQWPSGDKGAKYNDFFEEIHISGQRSWSEFTHIHEYGHHFVENFAVLNTPDYCNNVCDDDAGAWWPFESCGHCFRCGETNHDAFNEGFPDWMGDTITRAFVAEYDPDPIADDGSFYPNHEMWAACDKAGGSSDPWITEGAFAGMLRDITDVNAPGDADPSQMPGLDVLAMPTQDIFNLVDWDHPTNPADFLDKFRARFPAQTENLWLTARNNGYDFDAQKPGAPGNLRAPSHFLGGEAPDVTMDIAWDRPPDDAAGVDAYSYLVMNSVPPMPDTTPELGSVTSFTHPTPLAPGNYWIALRARDRTGKWSDNYAVAGPYGVRNPDPADLKMLTHVGWNLHSVLPREVGNTPTPANTVPLPPILYGNESGLYQAPFTYVNINYWNQGELPTAAPFWVSTFVDGGFAFTHYQVTPLQPVGVGWSPVINQPIVVRSGRHVIGARLDDGEGLAEPNEFNNEWARQWGFSAAVALSAGSPVSLAAPPFRYEGISWIVDGSPIYENSAGVVLNATAPWTAVAMRASGAADYDLRLHALDFSPYTAFGASVASSGRLAGQLDAVFVNANTMGALTYWNVGVVNWSSAFDAFTVDKIHSNAMAYGTPVAAAFAAGEMLKLWQVPIAAGQTGAVSVIADLDDPAQGPVYLSWLDRGFTVGGLANAAATAGSDPATGHIALALNVAQAGNHCLVAYRDPGLPTAKRATGAVTVTVQVGPALADIVPYAAAGWAAPLVPRSAPDGTASDVPAPAVLLGDEESYLNLATRNLTPTTPLTVNTILSVDGFTATSVPLSEVPATFSAYANSIPWNIPAGRHTLAMAADAWDEIPELIEANNVRGEAWVWTPPTMAPGLTVLRGLATDATSGWATVTTGEPLWPTCDGVRTPVIESDGQGNGAWGAVVVAPIDVDMDVALHEAATGPKDGFTVPLVSSAWGLGQSDYVLINGRLTAPRQFDAAITGVDLGGVLTYAYVEYVPSVDLGSVSGTYGPYVMDDLLDLYELALQPGSYNLHLHNVAGAVNWGMTVHPADLPFQSKSTSLPDALVDFYGAGEDESILLNIPAAGSYAIAVWKGSTSDAAVAGTYELIVSPGATAAPPAGPAALPATTALRAAHPNPFNPRTAIAFDLAQPGVARVDVYTLRGRHVRSLLSEARPAGRHELVWQGDDAAGDPVASGVYLVRLSAAGVVDQRKIVLAR